MQPIRAIILAVVLLCSYATVAWVRSGYQVEMRPPEVPLAAVPLQLGDWSGEDVAINDGTVRVIGAHSFINRLYRDPIGREVSFHAAAFTDPEYRASAPHHPQVCYPAAGWEIIERQSSTIQTERGAIPLEHILFQQGSERVVTTHWYQAGDMKFTGSDGPQSLIFRFWGQTESPCIEKFLVQIRQPSIEAAKPIVERFVALIENQPREIEREKLEVSSP